MGLSLVFLEAPLALHGLAADGADRGLEVGVLHRHVAAQVAAIQHLRTERTGHHLACNKEEERPDKILQININIQPDMARKKLKIIFLTRHKSIIMTCVRYISACRYPLKALDYNRF